MSTSSWTSVQEQLLGEWCEKAAGYRWLHERSMKYYKTLYYAISLPVIILSTLTGTANFGVGGAKSGSDKEDGFMSNIPMIIGSVNLFCGILGTIQNFLRFAECFQAHTNSSIQWSKFYRNISVELAIAPEDRQDVHDFLQICRAEYDRLIEQSPIVPDRIINQFKLSFKDMEISVPDICNGIHRTVVYNERKKNIRQLMKEAGLGNSLRFIHKEMENTEVIEKEMDSIINKKIITETSDSSTQSNYGDGDIENGTQPIIKDLSMV